MSLEAKRRRSALKRYVFEKSKHVRFQLKKSCEKFVPDLINTAEVPSPEHANTGESADTKLVTCNEIVRPEFNGRREVKSVFPGSPQPPSSLWIELNSEKIVQSVENGKMYVNFTGGERWERGGT